ncbi:MAG TPA: hypothetical protein VJK52_03490 [Candidatus Nanoarchaeia archaeon]|nr:hypothetical protein [Candidatus Nanoarchaeia archaeon]
MEARHRTIILLTILLMALLLSGSYLVLQEINAVAPTQIPAEPQMISTTVGYVTMNVVIPDEGEP